MLVIKNTTSGVIYPADRCSWVEAPASGGGYSINTVLFYDGVSAGATVATPVLGFIGKSGRFVKISS